MSQCKRSRPLYCDYMRYLSVPEELQWHCWRPYGAVTATELRFDCGFIRMQSHGAHFVHAQSAYCRKTFYNMLGDPIATYMMLLQRCRRLYCVTLAFYNIQGRSRIVLRTQSRKTFNIFNQADVERSSASFFLSLYISVIFDIIYLLMAQLNEFISYMYDLWPPFSEEIFFLQQLSYIEVCNYVIDINTIPSLIALV